MPPARSRSRNAFARQFETAADRFKDQVPAVRSKAALLSAIEDLQSSAPGNERIEQMAENVRRQDRSAARHARRFGDVESVFFRGVGPAATTSTARNSQKGCGIPRALAADGTIEDIAFRPDGDGASGEVRTCAQEQTLKAVPETVPIQHFVYNESGADIRVFALDGDGKRSRNIMIGDDRSAPFLAHVGEPWVVTNASGQCLEIIMPGQNTRFLTIRPTRASRPRALRRRAEARCPAASRRCANISTRLGEARRTTMP